MKSLTPRSGSLITSTYGLSLACLLNACTEDANTDTKSTTAPTSTVNVATTLSTANESGKSPTSGVDRDATSSLAPSDTRGSSVDVPENDAAPTAEVADAGSTTRDVSNDAGSQVTGQTSVGTRCDRASRIGSMSVNVDTSRTIVSGAISNAVLPSAVPAVHAETGSCQLLVPRDLFCEACASDEACAGDNSCVPKPVKVSAGVVHVSGLADPVDVSPNAITADYSKTILDPFPAYEVGATIEITALGDEAQGFTANLIGVPKITSPLATIAVTRGAGSTIEWDVTDVDPEQSAVFITFSVNVHGAVTGWIECVAPDTGNFEVPEELVTELVDLGLSGFPRADLERRSSATVQLTTGCVDVLVSSKVTLDIEVDGLTSCNDDTDCEQDQTCNEELACE